MYPSDSLASCLSSLPAGLRVVCVVCVYCDESCSAVSMDNCPYICGPVVLSYETLKCWDNGTLYPVLCTSRAQLSKLQPRLIDISINHDSSHETDMNSVYKQPIQSICGAHTRRVLPVQNRLVVSGKKSQPSSYINWTRRVLP